jgi:class 3 adenylate cyclase
LDGVIEAPGHDEHRDGKNAWALRVQDEEDGRFNKNLVLSADAFLLGRKTYQIWAAFWPTAAGGDEELTRRINEIPKYVVSNTLKSADWNNSTLISGDVVGEITRLKEQPGGDLLVYGSADLVDTLLEHDLVDEYRLLVYPVILGSGKHLFRDGIDLHHLRLVDSRTFGSGVVLLTYRPEQEAPTSAYVEEYSWSQEQVRSLHAAENVDRVLATVLFTDLVGSTERAAAMGDRAWGDLLDRHHKLVRSSLARWRGIEVGTWGDGFFATFDGPVRAIQCARAIAAEMKSLGLEVRAGLHTGEVEMGAADVTGLAVNIGARVATLAGPGEVLVSRTVKDLVAGSGLEFESRGLQELKGVPDRWEVFAVAG